MRTRQGCLLLTSLIHYFTEILVIIIWQQMEVKGNKKIGKEEVNGSCWQTNDYVENTKEFLNT
jgi:hypothetical protein